MTVSTHEVDLPRTHRRLGRDRASRLNWLHGLSSFCWGMVYPYTAIYLAREPEIGATGAGMYFAAAGFANVAIAVVLAAGLWRPPRTLLGVLGNGMSMLGYAGLAFVDNRELTVLAGLCVGLGQGAFMAAIIPTVNALIHPEDRRSVFAARYAILNATLAAGALTTGLATLVIPAEVLLGWLFPITAAGYLPLICAQVALRRHAVEAPADPDHDAPSPGRRRRRTRGGLSGWQLVRATAWLMAFQLTAYLIGFSQLEATAPLSIDLLLGIPLVWVSVMLGINIVTIVVAQAWVTRVLAPYSTAVGLKVALLAWAIAYLVMAIGGLSGSSPGSIAGIVLFAVIFALGECAYSCTFHPWLVSAVPDRELTRATALANSTMGIGLFAGPLLGVALVGTGSTLAVWGCLAVIAVVGSLAAHRVPSTAEGSG